MARRRLTSFAKAAPLPGDIIELKSRGGLSSYGVYVASKADALGRTSVRSINPQGQLQSNSPLDITFHIPGWSRNGYISTHPPSVAPPISESARLLYAETTTREVNPAPYDVGPSHKMGGTILDRDDTGKVSEGNEGEKLNSIMHHFRRFLRFIETDTTTHNRCIQTSQKLLASESSRISIHDFAGRVFGVKDPSDGQALLVHRWITSNSGSIYFSAPAHLQSDAVVRLNSVERVARTLWMRFECDGKSCAKLAYPVPWDGPRGSHLSAFIDKVVASRQEESIGPLVENGPEGVFVHALKETALLLRQNASAYREICEDFMLPELRSVQRLGSGIKAPPNVEAMNVLISLGVWPLDISLEGMRIEFYSRDGNAWINDMDMAASNIAERIVKSHGRMEKVDPVASTPWLPGNVLENLERHISQPSGALAGTSRDSVASMRQSVTDTTFVIDSTTANELDDGISISPVDPTQPIDPSDATANWIHVHVADPTSLIAPNDPLSLTSQFKGISSYLPHTCFPMMPPILSKEAFNLANGRNALTFSARLDSFGEIIDYKVRPSLLENVCKTNYKDVDGVLSFDGVCGFKDDDPYRAYLEVWDKDFLQARRAQSVSTAPSSLGQEKVDLLRGCQAITSLHSKHRVSSGRVETSFPEDNVHVRPFGARAGPEPAGETTVYMSLPASTLVSPARSMVAEAMIIAGRVAAKFCTDHQIPILYRGVGPLVPEKGDPEEFERIMQQLRAVKCTKTGTVPRKIYNQLIQYHSGAFNDPRPLMHSHMGILGVNPLDGSSEKEGMIGYVKATSPLRRFSDMIAHWHIKTALAKTRNFAFNVDQLTSIFAADAEKQKASRKLENAWGKYWKLEWARRRELTVQQGRQNDAEYVDSSNEYLGIGHKSSARKNAEMLSFPLHTYHQQPVYTCVIVPGASRNAPFAKVLVVELSVYGWLGGVSSITNRSGIVKAKISSIWPAGDVLRLSPI